MKLKGLRDLISHQEDNEVGSMDALLVPWQKGMVYGIASDLNEAVILCRPPESYVLRYIHTHML